jgi:hypothetical protein
LEKGILAGRNLLCKEGFSGIFVETTEWSILEIFLEFLEKLNEITGIPMELWNSVRLPSINSVAPTAFLRHPVYLIQYSQKKKLWIGINFKMFLYFSFYFWFSHQLWKKWE